MAWSDDILQDMKTKDPNHITEAKASFKIKVEATMGIWWPDIYDVDHQIYSEAVTNERPNHGCVGRKVKA